MKKQLSLILVTFVCCSIACKRNGPAFDATGIFESTETLVSSENAGRIVFMPVQEGMWVTKDSIAARIDAGNLQLQEAQVAATEAALNQKTASVGPQLQLLEDQWQVQQTQLHAAIRELDRFRRLVEADAATPKQLNELETQVATLQKQMAVTRQQMAVQRSNIDLQNRSILSERQPLQKRRAQIADQINRSDIRYPVSGVVLATYAHEGEITTPGKPLFKMADIRQLQLKAYITGDQLSVLKIGMPVTVLVDDPKSGYRSYAGKLIWIADKAEFTPKTIQTKDERANLVYAIKINVPNDGLLKIGMYGEVKFNNHDSDSN